MAFAGKAIAFTWDWISHAFSVCTSDYLGSRPLVTGRLSILFRVSVTVARTAFMPLRLESRYVVQRGMRDWDCNPCR